MELLQWHKVYKLGEAGLHKLHVVDSRDWPCWPGMVAYDTSISASLAGLAPGLSGTRPCGCRRSRLIIHPGLLLNVESVTIPCLSLSSTKFMTVTYIWKINIFFFLTFQLLFFKDWCRKYIKATWDSGHYSWQVSMWEWNFQTAFLDVYSMHKKCVPHPLHQFSVLLLRCHYIS